jgi:hypothetical protein
LWLFFQKIKFDHSFVFIEPYTSFLPQKNTNNFGQAALSSQVLVETKQENSVVSS